MNSFELSSDLVSNAYANLVSFSDVEDVDGSRFYVAKICFMPDPVCAALAMGLMEPGWKIGSSSRADYVVQGKSKAFLERSYIAPVPIRSVFT